jgi:hypothetical protein
MHPIYNIIKNKNPSGISIDEATQLFILLYCTLDFLPEEVRNLKLEQVELVEVFKGLNQDVFFHGPGLLPNWDQLVNLFLDRKVSIDPDFIKRASKYI